MDDERFDTFIGYQEIVLQLTLKFFNSTKENMKIFSEIKGTFAWVSAHRPRRAYQHPLMPFTPDEFSTCLIITDLNEVNKLEELIVTFGLKLKITEVNTEELKLRIKCELPKDAGKTSHTVTFRKSTETEGVKIKPEDRPVVYYNIQDSLINITHDVQVANGSKGTLRFEIAKSKRGFNYSLLNALIVDELIEYK